MQQCDPQSEDEFEDGSFISDAQSMMPIDDMGFPTMGFDAFTFSEIFEWDLANLVRPVDFPLRTFPTLIPHMP
jgi:hypothetical protein